MGARARAPGTQLQPPPRTRQLRWWPERLTTTAPAKLHVPICDDGWEKAAHASREAAALFPDARFTVRLVPGLRAIPNASPARGLHTIAEEEDAALIVVGSRHRGAVARRGW